MLREFAARHFPEGCEATMSLKACMFTNTPDRHFVIDLHPVYPQVSFCAGFSGHGFKFASVIGEIMADLAERWESRHNIEFFRLERLTGAPRQHLGRQTQPTLNDPMLTRHSPNLARVGRGEPRRRVEPQRPGQHRLGQRLPHHRHHRERAYDYYESTLPEEGVGAIRPFW
jgi:hypothetical protein